MKTHHSLSHMKWDCKYHIVWISKCRKKRLFWESRQALGPVPRELAKHRGGEILEGRLRPEHVPILISIRPKFAMSRVVGYIKGKNALYIARSYLGRRRDFKGRHFYIIAKKVSIVKPEKAGDYPYLKECLDMGECRHISPQDMGEPAFTVPNGLVGNPQRRGKVSQSYLDSPHLLW